MLNIESVEQAQVIWVYFHDTYQLQQGQNHLIPQAKAELDFSDLKYR